jgi:peptidyl-prolyl cis-trans isomerase C
MTVDPTHTAPSPVSVNGFVISRREIAAEVQNFSGNSPIESWHAATQALVIRELLFQEARRIGIEAEQRTDSDGRKETEEDALLRALVESQVRLPDADEETLRRFYANNRRHFMTPPLYEVQHILVGARRDQPATFAAARDKAASIRAELLSAPDRFAALARAVSDCPSAEIGGSLGQIRPGDTTPEFEQALAGLTAGSISEPVETRYGVHLIRLERRIDSSELPFEAVKDHIAAYLDEHVRRQATAQYIALLIGRADIRGIALAGASSPLIQ